MFFSVIVPFLNEEAFLDDCIASLLAQTITGHERELLFVDTGSTDTSVDIVKRYPQITLLTVDQKNPYVARNAALSRAQGEIVVFTDADCRVSPDWLKSIQATIENTGAQVVFGKRIFPEPKSKLLSMLEAYDHNKMAYVYNNKLKECYYGYTNNMAMTKSMYTIAGNFLESIGTAGDSEYVHRLRSRVPNCRIVYTPGICVTHLEIRSTQNWLNKYALYAQHNVRIAGSHPYRALRLFEKIAILHMVLHDAQWSVFSIGLCVAALAWGNALYLSGTILGLVRMLGLPMRARGRVCS